MDLTEAEVIKKKWQEYTESESEVAQSCPTLCDPMDCSLPCSSLHGILQARVLEWVAISFSRGSPQPRDQTQVFYVSCAGRQVVYHQCHLGSPYIFEKPLKSLSCVRLFVTPWTVAYHAPPSMGFSRQEYWSRLPFPSPRKYLCKLP